MSNIAIKIENVSKKYRIGEMTGYKTMRDVISKFAKSSLKPKTNGNSIWALKDITFNVGQGESVGIIGANGSGKSTLLKIISRVTVPTEGRVEIFGKVGALLEVGIGFNPELTGRENIYLNGTILGLKRNDIKEKYDSIVEFSGISRFLATPIKHYSSGMQVRLAFSIAIHVETNILLIDEVLAVGDMDFQKKCLAKLYEVKNEGRTIVFVSHNLTAVKDLCSRAIVLKEGQMIEDGNALEIVEKYGNPS